MEGGNKAKAYGRSDGHVAGGAIGGGYAETEAGSRADTMRAMVAEQLNCSQNIRSRASRTAHSSAMDSVRHERLAEKLTPEIENVLWCLQESIALGYINLEELLKRSLEGDIRRWQRCY